ncbi:uncharacterized protein [Anabrus simplex]|uniref:uncharacterized protein n=1 Tax=Anabrus simplex TaxID=316456 RepID=UPI0035A27E49
MNSEKFQMWVKTQLIVGLRNIGPCVIVMDNAPYHCKLVEHQPTTKWRKDQLVSWLRQNGVSPPENATKDELQRLCNMNRSHLKRYIVDEMLHSEGHTVLRLPPYHSFFNAIEFVWSVAKQYYNKTVASRPDHGLDRATAVWKESLDQVTAEMWRNEVKHTEKKIVEFYNNEVRGLPEVEERVIHHGSSCGERSRRLRNNHNVPYTKTKNMKNETTMM